jgi:hypothetical protein
MVTQDQNKAELKVDHVDFRQKENVKTQKILLSITTKVEIQKGGKEGIKI